MEKHRELGPSSREELGDTSALSRLDRHLRSVVMGLMLVLAVGAGIGIDRYLVEFTPVGAQGEAELTAVDEFTTLEETYEVIRDNYVESDEITDQELIWGASTGMVDALGDTGHSTFLDPEEAIAFERSSRGELIGIGIQIDSESSPPRVIVPIQNSPAFKAGIQPGDIILTVDGQDTTELEPGTEVGSLIRGEEGTDVTLELQHQGETGSYEVTITRTRIKVDPVSWAMLPDDVLWIRLSEFSSGATESMQAALREGKKLGAKSVILDLRANPGGLVFEAMGVGSQFLPDDSVLYRQLDREGQETGVRTVGSNGEWQDSPVIVLIDGDSASAAEIVSSALRDNERAELVGETTYGTGTVLLPIELDDGSSVLIGTDLWLTADGEEIWKKGVDPTIEVENEVGVPPSFPYLFENNQLTDTQLEELPDAQLVRAYEEITGDPAP